MRPLSIRVLSRNTCYVKACSSSHNSLLCSGRDFKKSCSVFTLRVQGLPLYPFAFLPVKRIAFCILAAAHCLKNHVNKVCLFYERWKNQLEKKTFNNAKFQKPFILAIENLHRGAGREFKKRILFWKKIHFVFSMQLPAFQSSLPNNFCFSASTWL